MLLNNFFQSLENLQFNLCEFIRFRDSNRQYSIQIHSIYEKNGSLKLFVKEGKKEEERSASGTKLFRAARSRTFSLVKFLSRSRH